MQRDFYSKLNIVGGLLLIAMGIFHGMFMSASRDFNLLENVDKIRGELTPQIARKWIELAHAHWGVLGIANIAIGIVLSLCAVSQRQKAIIGWLAFGGGILVPSGFILWLIHPALIYIQIAGTLSLLASIFWTAWVSFRKAK